MLNVLFLQALAMWLTALVVPRFRITSVFGAFLIVFAIALLNATIWSDELFLNIPNNFSSFTLQLLAVNGVLFWVLVKIVPGIEIKGFAPAIVAPLIFSISSSLVGTYCKDIDWIKVYQSGAKVVGNIKDNLLQEKNGQAGAREASKETPPFKQDTSIFDSVPSELPDLLSDLLN